MYYVVKTAKSFDQASADLELAVKRLGFGVLHVYDLGTTLRSKVFEVCNPQQAARVLSAEMRRCCRLPKRSRIRPSRWSTRRSESSPYAIGLTLGAVLSAAGGE